MADGNRVKVRVVEPVWGRWQFGWRNGRPYLGHRTDFGTQPWYWWCLDEVDSIAAAFHAIRHISGKEGAIPAEDVGHFVRALDEILDFGASPFGDRLDRGRGEVIDNVRERIERVSRERMSRVANPAIVLEDDETWLYRPTHCTVVQAKAALGPEICA